jgi:hypothetical protein
MDNSKFKLISVRLTVEDYAKIQEKTKEFGLGSVSAFIRFAAFHTQPPVANV